VLLLTPLLLLLLLPRHVLCCCWSSLQEVEQVQHDQLSQQPRNGHPLWTPPDLGLVSRLTKLDTEHVIAAAQGRVSEPGGAHMGRGGADGKEVAPADVESGSGSKSRKVEQAELVKEYRRRFLCMNKAHYGEGWFWWFAFALYVALWGLAASCVACPQSFHFTRGCRGRPTSCL
jgi:hypothetical protein